MSLPRALAIPAAVVVILTVVGAWVDGSDSASLASSTPRRGDDAGRRRRSATVAVDRRGAAGDAAPASTVTPTATSCTSVVHIGDSTSVGLISEDFIADPANRIDAQYRRVGVTDPRMEISGARSIVETVGDQLNAEEAAEAIKATGYEGCWVLAMGTTDTANVAVGSPTGLTERIDRMLAVIGDDPIMWVTVKTLDVDGERGRTRTCRRGTRRSPQAQARYPNIEVYDWAAVAQDPWFQTDNIHYTSAGYTERARLIADALVTTYPAS